MSALSPGDDPWIGRVIDGRYRIVRRLGEGGMGIVLEAEHMKLGKRVALKIVAPERVGDPELAARFTREARATAQIEHPHIASGFDYGLLPEGGAFLVAQLVRGSSLRERIERGPIPWPQACGIAAQIADALSAVHAAGYVHRDLTPENVLVTARDDGREHVYVLDFGVAALVAARDGSGPQLTEAGTVVGTNGYMAPEQALGRPVDPRADLYVVGVLLWEMIAGARLFAAASSMTEIVAAQLASTRAEPPSSGAPLPFDLERLLRDLLNADAARRPSSAAELRAMLVRIAEGLPARDPAIAVASAAPAVDGSTLRAAAIRAAIRASAIARTPQGALAIAAGAGLAVLATVSTAVVVVTARDPVRTPATIPAPAPTEVAMPAIAPGIDPPAATPIDDHVARMASALHRERESAAGAILAADPSATPPFARALASLIVANTCAERAQHLAWVGSIGDPRAVRALERLRDAPRRGCGRRGRSDCFACIRRDLDATIAALHSRHPSQEDP